MFDNVTARIAAHRIRGIADVNRLTIHAQRYDAEIKSWRKRRDPMPLGLWAGLLGMMLPIMGAYVAQLLPGEKT